MHELKMNFDFALYIATMRDRDNEVERISGVSFLAAVSDCKLSPGAVRLIEIL
jgi:hypothetical protein